MKNENKPIWIVRADSESGDHYGPFRFNHKPSKKELMKLITDTGEELNCNSPGDFNSYVHLTIDKI